MRAYGELVVSGFRRYSRYRAGLVAALFTNCLFGFIRASLLIATITAAGTTVGGYDALRASTYVWVGQGLLGAIPLWVVGEVAERVKTGDIAVDLLRPVWTIGQWWAVDLGRAASQVLPRLVPMVAVGALTTGVALPRRPEGYLFFVVSLALAASLAFFAWLLVSLLALWVTEVRGYQNLFMMVLGLLAGLIVPVSWFPDWLRVADSWTPFPSMFQAPVEVMMSSPASAQIIGTQAAWLAVLIGVAQVMLVRGSRRLVVNGG